VSHGRGGRTDHQLVPLRGPPLRSFPPRRVCGVCATVLSIYNGTAFYSLHEGPGMGFLKPGRVTR
jgi:hypothetical protein